MDGNDTPGEEERRAPGREPAPAAKIYNERIKTSASAVNAVSIALVGAAFVFPVIRDENLGALLEARTWIWILAGLGIHLGALALLGRLKKED